MPFSVKAERKRGRKRERGRRGRGMRTQCMRITAMRVWRTGWHGSIWRSRPMPVANET